MKKKIYLLFLLLFFSSLAFTQNLKMSVQDSLLQLKLQKIGKEASQLGDFKSALESFEQLYQLRKKIYGSNSYKLASPLTSIGIQYKNLQDFDKAIEAYKSAEQLYIAEFGEDNPLLGAMYINWGNIYRLKGRL